MALDFHRLDTNKYLFGLDDEQYNYLAPIVEAFYNRAGVYIDPYKNMQLTIENCKTIVQVIDNYIHHTDINRDKKRTVAILAFKGLLSFFIEKHIDFYLHGD